MGCKARSGMRWYAPAGGGGAAARVIDAGGRRGCWRAVGGNINHPTGPDDSWGCGRRRAAARPTPAASCHLNKTERWSMRRTSGASGVGLAPAVTSRRDIMSLGTNHAEMWARPCRMLMASGFGTGRDGWDDDGGVWRPFVYFISLFSRLFSSNLVANDY